MVWLYGFSIHHKVGLAKFDWDNESVRRSILETPLPHVRRAVVKIHVFSQLELIFVDLQGGRVSNGVQTLKDLSLKNFARASMYNDT